MFALIGFLAWRKVLAVPDGLGDVNGLFIATVGGRFGLALLGSRLQHYQRKRHSHRVAA